METSLWDICAFFEASETLGEGNQMTGLHAVFRAGAWIKLIGMKGKVTLERLGVVGACEMHREE